MIRGFPAAAQKVEACVQLMQTTAVTEVHSFCDAAEKQMRASCCKSTKCECGHVAAARAQHPLATQNQHQSAAAQVPVTCNHERNR